MMMNEARQRMWKDRVATAEVHLGHLDQCLFFIDMPSCVCVVAIVAVLLTKEIIIIWHL